MRTHIFACLLVVACGGGTVQGSDAGDSGGNDTGTGGDGTVGLDELGTPCQAGACPSGLEPVVYCGFAGCSDGGGQSCSCEIRCGQNAGVCPTGSSCVTISDGPGEVCVKN